MKRAAFRIAKSEGQASSIVNQLKGAGFAENDIPVLLCDNTGYRRFAHGAQQSA